MNCRRTHILLVVTLLAALLPARAQQGGMERRPDGLLRQPEYGYSKVESQTLFGTRLSPEIGVRIGHSAIMAGASWVQPIDGSTENARIHPTVYYRYSSPRFRMSMGMFPRTQLIENEPAILQYDSLTYYRPNIAGALFQYVHPKGFAELYVDWRQVQTEVKREAFMVVFNGRWQPLPYLFAGGHLVMNHLARPRHSDDRYTVTDNLIVSPYVGLDLTPCTPLDTLTLKAGYHLSLDRLRNVGTWHHPQGLLVDLRAEWRFLGLHNTFYKGGAQMPLYPQLGAQLNQGDPFYQSPTYNRTDIYAYLFRKSYLNCLASFNLHYTPGNLDFQQQLVLRFYLDDQAWKERKTAKNRGYLKNIL